jgi:serine O-acetyltransferase
MKIDATSLYRLSSALNRRGARRMAHLVKGVSFFLFKASIPPEITVGENFRLGHRGLGVVIHKNTEIGSDVFLQHNVTLATDVSRFDSRRMVIGNDVSIGTGAILVGPITIGDNTVVGAGAVVVDDVPSNVVVAGVPAKIVSRRGDAAQSAALE